MHVSEHVVIPTHVGTQGVMKFRNGDIYTGQWKDNMIHGEGTMVYSVRLVKHLVMICHCHSTMAKSDGLVLYSSIRRTGAVQQHQTDWCCTATSDGLVLYSSIRRTGAVQQHG
jgi:hypothetical protein